MEKIINFFSKLDNKQKLILAAVVGLLIFLFAKIILILSIGFGAYGIYLWNKGRKK